MKQAGSKAFRVTPIASAVATGLALAGSLAIAGCGGTETGGNAATATGDHVVERGVENGVETVHNLSGSRWGGNATLVEEISIGDEIGEQSYLFGNISGAWATDERFYLIDAQVPAVRAFDRDGRYLFDVGRPGQGPGEYNYPTAIAVTNGGNVAIADAMSARITIYDRDGELIEDWPLQSQKSALGLVPSYDGEMFTQSWSLEAGRMGMQAVGPEGLVGEILFPPPNAYMPASVAAGKGLEVLVPFAPEYSWTFAPGGEILAGVGDEYRFEIHRRDGTITHVERSWEPVAVQSGEADYRAELATNAIRRFSPDGGMSSSEVAENKPAFVGIYPDRAGRVWLVRQGPGRPDPTCDDTASGAAARVRMAMGDGESIQVGAKIAAMPREPVVDNCWADAVTFDLFDIRTGEFLGTVDAPENGFQRPMFGDNETVLAAVTDDAGTVRLKAYRLQIEDSE